MILNEAQVTIPDGMSLLDWIGKLEKGAIAAIIPLIPPAVPTSRGSLPDQWARMLDASAESVVVSVIRYTYEPEHNYRDSERNRDEWTYQVPYTATEQAITFGTPQQVQIVMKAVVVPVNAIENVEEDLETRIYKACFKLREARREGGVLSNFEALDDARKVLAEASGRHELASLLAVEISKVL